MYFVALSEFVKVFLYEIRSESVTLSLICSEESLGLLRFLLVERLEFELVVEFELEVELEFEIEFRVEVKLAASLPILLKGLSGFMVKSILLSMTVGLGLRVVAVVRFFLGLVVVVLKSTLLSTAGLDLTVVVVDGFGRAVTMRGPSISKSRLLAIGWFETP
jgi:hypothetical protein